MVVAKVVAVRVYACCLACRRIVGRCGLLWRGLLPLLVIGRRRTLLGRLGRAGGRFGYIGRRCGGRRVGRGIV